MASDESSGAGSRLRDLGLPAAVVRFLLRQESVAVGSIRVQPLEGDASDRNYLRLTMEGRGGGKRFSYVLMELSSPWLPRGSKPELPFVNIARHLKEKGVPVPEVFVDASQEGCVLLEDVGGRTLETCLETDTAEARRRRYECAIEILVRMQSEGSRPSSRPCQALSYSFDAETFFKELRFFRQYALEGLWGHALSEVAGKELDEHFRRLCAEIAEYPKVFTHRDYHSRNLVVQGDRLAVLDFQDARLGPVTYDLASLLRDSYVFLASEEQQALLTAYRELARRAGLAIAGPDEFEQAFRRTALQRNLKAIGTFAYQAVVKGTNRYLSSIPNTLRSVRDVLEMDTEMASFRSYLQSLVEGL